MSRRVGPRYTPKLKVTKKSLVRFKLFLERCTRFVSVYKLHNRRTRVILPGRDCVVRNSTKA